MTSQLECLFRRIVHNEKPTGIMSEFVTVAKVGAIPEGRGLSCIVNGQMVAVFYVLLLLVIQF